MTAPAVARRDREASKTPPYGVRVKATRDGGPRGGDSGGANRGIRLSDPHLVQGLYQGYMAFRTSLGPGGSNRGLGLSAPHLVLGL